MSILVTGGTGYIGSHTVVELLNSGEDVIIVDNLYNSKLSVLDKIETITGIRPKFYHEDAADRAAMDKIFAENSIEAVIHFAGLKAVGESVQKPLEYYRVNLDSAVVTMETMRKYGCKCFIFSSSATVYGEPETVPIREDFPVATPTSPYGKTKLMIEQIMQDVYAADDTMSMVILRYFNPIGAHESGLLGEEPNGIPNNLMPYITEVAAGRLPELHVYGDDYPTKDGTCIRDYIHVTDLAQAHILAVDYLMKGNDSNIFNLGNGVGFTVNEVIETARKVTGHPIPAVMAERRAGDPAQLIASSEKAKTILGWKPEHADLEEIIATAWKWHSTHPNGYAK